MGETMSGDEIVNDLSIVCGAGGFIGGHLVRALLAQGNRVRAVDIKPLYQWYQRFDGVDNVGNRDLRSTNNCWATVDGGGKKVTIYNAACAMGGMGWIESNKTACMLNVLINTNLLWAITPPKDYVSRFFYFSTACVYRADLQDRPDVTALKEYDAYPAMPEDGYGWEKLFSERMCRHFREDFGLQTRIARLHNCYGPNGTYDGGREKAPAAICRKVIQAKLSGKHEIEIWGDGEQTRSFMYIDDCIRGILDITAGDYADPVNLGTSEMVTINQLVSTVEEIAGITLKRWYNLDAPKGVRGRSSDNTLFRSLYGWEPSIKLRDGLEKTYRWIYEKLA